MSLQASDFSSFYSEVHGVIPFPWQTDLVEQILREGAWPDLVDVPTGLGKTAMIDIGVFVAAATAGMAGSGRLGRRRIFFVVDRRIVVDEAHWRAETIAHALASAARGGTTDRVAQALRSLAPEVDLPLVVPPPKPFPPARHPPLKVTRMRGGITWDAAWLDRPDVAGVVVGTVDQIGSRIFFRGYGVSDRRKPIDAALTGMDSLVLVDEAHLARAMIATLSAAHRRDQAGVGLPSATVVQLTATPTRSSSRPYQFDVDAHRANTLAWRRLNAAKGMTVRSSDPKQIVQVLADEAAAAVAAGFDTVMVVCNTVDRARQVHDVLAKATSAKRSPLDADLDLLIGRSRPADRELLVQRVLGRFGLERLRPAVRPAILVATQTVEVGANLDADALVSESAPWDALVQRLGRVNRLGQSASEARAVVVHDGADSVLYGLPRLVTWERVSTLAGESGIDVSPLACRSLTDEMPDGAFSQTRTAPLLTIPTLDSWTRTAPTPTPDAPLAPYLHGIGSTIATVSIAWRDGLLADDPMGDDAERPETEIDAELSMLPILPTETVEVPLHAARRWLSGETPTPVSDLDDDPETPVLRRAPSDPFRALAWRGSDAVSRPGRARQVSSGAWVWVDGAAIRPGDQLVVPAERGGLDEYGWAPTSTDPVIDVAEVVRFAPGADVGRGRLRLDGLTATRLGLHPDDREMLNRSRRALVSDEEDSDGAGGDPVDAVLVSAVGHLLAGEEPLPDGRRLTGTAWTPEALRRLADWLPDKVAREIPIGPSIGADRFILAAPRGGTVERDDEQPECSSLGLSPVSLAAHHRNVGDRARAISEALGLPAALCDAVDAAARWHDLGKAEGRFQTMLCGGDDFEALLLDEPLAKSGLDPSDRAGFVRARILSKLPAGTRHEAWSAALVRRHLQAGSALAEVDLDLVIHLVASHHGHARPWLPPIADDRPTDLTVVIESGPLAGEAKVTINTAEMVDLEHPGRFAGLNRRYGRWGLALLEAIVRCADMTVSEEGS